MQESFFTEKANTRSRIILKKGAKSIPVKSEDIALFYTESKIMFAVDRENNKYMCDKNLGELEMSLNDEIFFRANRQYIININFIKAFQTYQRVKIKVELSIADTDYAVMVSQVTATGFKKWLTGTS